MKKAEIGMIGLAVMGENLAMNMESRGFTVAVYNRTVEKVDAFTESRARGKNIIGCHTLQELTDCLEKPRKVFLMIRAGDAVDRMIEQLLPLLEPGDILIDGGNSHFRDTIRRTEYVESRGLLYVGTGVSGGEEGALKGPSIMPGGSPAAWPYVKPIFQSICARAEDGSPCCEWVGENGAGHFVKMVHNGIEYGDMQLICEVYQLMRDGLGMSNEDMHDAFAAWNQTELHSYLIEITRDILACRDENGEYVVDTILDAAGQKGTGKWTGIAALEEEVPLTLIAEAVSARFLSAQKGERTRAADRYPRIVPVCCENRAEVLERLRQALYAGKIVSYAQGFALMRSAAQTYGWNLNYGRIAMMWRGGCIIRSSFLEKIGEAYDRNPELENLLMDDYFADTIQSLLPAWRDAAVLGIRTGIPMPAINSALTYFDGYTTRRLPSNLLQAQRDYFGAHTYQRLDSLEGQTFHTDWTGQRKSAPQRPDRNGIRLIAVGLDNTLLNSRKEISPRNLQALERAAAAGVEIVPATARFFEGMPDCVRELPFLHYAITINGAQIYDARWNRVLVRRELPLPLALEIMTALDSFPVIYDCYQEDWGYITESMQKKAADFIPDPPYLKMVQGYRTPVPELKQWLRDRGKNVQKIQLFTPSPDLHRLLMTALAERYRNTSVTSAVGCNIEINAQDTDKGKALETLAGFLNLDLSQTAAFGYGVNDVSLLRRSGTGVAMGNACPEAIHAANLVTSSHDEDGVAEGIERLGIF